ncbi:MAG: N-acetylmuramoyl-L-alanine amidase [Bacteroidales bacterium]|nr:N-acetylmuramoyl-L-alanine amidase [Bacteroidales bacterium]
MKRFFSMFASACLVLAITVPASAQENASKSQMRLGTVVIDPGHGGKDAGCISRDKKTYEKNITLDISKRLSQKIADAYPETAVLMTRGDDTFVELENRAVSANKAGAGLFISIHVNAVEKGTTANGYSIHCLGQSRKKGNDLYSKNLDLVKRENSVIMLEEGYETTYQGFDPNDPQSSIIFNLMQNAHLGNSLAFAEDVAAAMSSGPIKNSRGVSQDPFWVLWRTAMPAVLIEVGFITNPDDLEILRSESGRDAIAENIFKAFTAFKARYDGSMQPEIKEDAAPSAAPASEKKEEPVKEKAKEPVKTVQGPRYGTQILVTSKNMDLNDPFFAGYKPTLVKSGKYNKYIVGISSSQAEAKKQFAKIQKIFPDAFIVKLAD